MTLVADLISHGHAHAFAYRYRFFVAALEAVGRAATTGVKRMAIAARAAKAGKDDFERFLDAGTEPPSHDEIYEQYKKDRS